MFLGDSNHGNQWWNFRTKSVETLVGEQANSKCCLRHSPWELSIKICFSHGLIWQLKQGASAGHRLGHSEKDKQLILINQSQDKKQEQRYATPLILSDIRSSSMWQVSPYLHHSLLSLKLPHPIFTASTLRTFCRQF